VLEIQGRLFRVATSYPPRGCYRKISVEGDLSTAVMIEETRMVVSFISESDFTRKALKEITGFLREFGRKTHQESVAFVVDGEMFYIDIIPKIINK
jgi:hypothetical protein